MRLLHVVVLLLLPGSAALLPRPLPLLAAPLDKAICGDLQVERGLLQQKGVAGDMAKGPDWAKANLPADRLKDIERLIHVEEQLLFRCPQPKRPATAAAGDDDDDDAPAPAKAKVKPAAKSAQPKAAAEGGAQPAPPRKPAKTAASEAGGGGAESPTPQRKPAPRTKPKADDAYVPPPAQ